MQPCKIGNTENFPCSRRICTRFKSSPKRDCMRKRGCSVFAFRWNKKEQKRPTRPMTSAAAPPPPPADEPSLLREWSYPPRPSMEETEPPVAPAILVKEVNEESREDDINDDEATPMNSRSLSFGQSYSYPVATFVSSLVRQASHTVDNIHAGISALAPSPAAEMPLEAHGESEDFAALSIRSEPFAAHWNLDQNNVSDRSLQTVSGQDQYAHRRASTTDEPDYIFVDGELIAVPHQYYSNFINDDDDFDLQGHELFRKQASNMKRFKKWVKKRTFGRSAPKNAPKNEGDKKLKRSKKHKRRQRKRTSSCEGLFQTSDLVLQQQQAPNRPRVASSTHVMQQQQQQQLSSPAQLDTLFQEARLIGNADQAAVVDVLNSCALASAYIEAEDDEKNEDTLYTRKIDPLHEHLAMAREEDSDLESSISHIPLYKSPKESTSKEVPLSCATASNKDVYNDTMKLFMVGAPGVGKSSLVRSLRNKSAPKRDRRRSERMHVSAHEWTPTPASLCGSRNHNVRFSVWDINEGVTSGTHPATQSLFFSSDSLYVLVWDMAWSNDKTHRRTLQDEDSDDDDDDDDYVLEESNRQADLALEVDIQERVLKWVDKIAKSSSGTAILPVATIPEGMDECEAQRRCSMLHALLLRHVHIHPTSPKLVGENIVLRVNANNGHDDLQEAILSVVCKEHSLFSHLGAQVPYSTVQVLDTVQRLEKEEGHKVVLVEQIVVETGLSNVDVHEALRFLSSVGELLYFGQKGDSTTNVLSLYVVLSHRWLVSALSCILHCDLKRELDDVRTFMNMQCEYGGKQYVEDDVTRTLLRGSTPSNKGSNSNCPVLGSGDAAMLWAERDFMRAAANRTAEINSNTASESMFEFLEQLMIHAGVFVSLHAPSDNHTNNVYFVPSLVPHTATQTESNVWTYKSSESWMTTLCHSWLLRDGAPSNMMEHITVSLLEDLYEFASATPRPKNRRTKTYPMDNSTNRQLPVCSDVTEGSIKIRQVMCWDSAFLVTIGYVYEDTKTQELRESTAEVFVALVDQSSNHCVASSAMRGGMKRLIVCGRGQVGHHGQKLWKGGYGLVLDSIKTSVANLPLVNVDRLVVCPDCLSQSHASMASTWSWDDVRAENVKGHSSVVCMRGHRIDANLLCGTCQPRQAVDLHHAIAPRVPVATLTESVVVVALWDEDEQQILQVGSGFIVDKKQGLIVTAAHTLFDMDKGKHFGERYHGLKNAKALIGVMPDTKGSTAVFRYSAEIVADDVANMDACILRITARFENDVGGDGEDCAHEPEIDLTNDMEAIKGENLHQLKLTKQFELEEAIRVLGFNQGGEGLLEEGNHINRYIDVARGYVCKTFKALPDDGSDSSGLSTSQMKLLSRRPWIPREEIVAMCPTINGHSGGPCVNGEGRVIGIVSRADPSDPQRCYLVPASELKKLVVRAKKACLSKSDNTIQS